MQKLTPTQKKLIIAAAIVALAFVVFLLGIYLPNKNAVVKIKAELAAAEAQLEEIKIVTGESRSVNEAMQLLMQRYSQLHSRFPEKEEEGLRLLSQLTRQLNIELISIQPQAKRTFCDENNKPIEIEGKTAQSVFINISLRCFYQDLVKYIEAVQKSLPCFVTVERLGISKEKSGLTRLNVTLELKLYLLS